MIKTQGLYYMVRFMRKGRAPWSIGIRLPCLRAVASAVGEDDGFIAVEEAKDAKYTPQHHPLCDAATESGLLPIGSAAEPFVITSASSAAGGY